VDIRLARVAWFVLPLTAGVALADAIDGWAREPAIVAQVLAWSAWTLGAFVLLAARPWGFTALRVLAPAALVIAITCAWWAAAPAAALGVGTTALAAVLALGAGVATASANGAAYGDEQRFPLRAPLPLLAGPLPLAAVVVAATVAAPPLLLAAGNPLGAVVLVVGAPSALLAVRALHGLARRMVVLVPAGVVVIDALTLSEPVLVPRERVASLERSDLLAAPEGALDLRLGTALGTVALHLRQPVTFLHRRARTEGALVSPTTVLVAPLRPRALLAAAARRRLPVA
jgi:hypothetical protein